MQLKKTDSKEVLSWFLPNVSFFHDRARFSLSLRKKGRVGSNTLYKNRENKRLHYTANDWRPSCDLPKAAVKPLIWLKGYSSFMHGRNNK